MSRSAVSGSTCVAAQRTIGLNTVVVAPPTFSVRPVHWFSIQGSHPST
jgi:hypothetical protein